MTTANERSSNRKIALLLPPIARTIRWAPQVASGPIAFWIVYAGVHAKAPAGHVHLPMAGLTLCAAAGFLLDDDAAATVGCAPTPLAARRAIRIALGMPLVWAIWGALAWYAAALTTAAAIEFAGTLALTLALAAICADVIGEERAGVFAPPALFTLLGASAFVSARWRPVPVLPVGSTWFDLYGRWVIVLIVSVAVFLVASADPARRPPARKAISLVIAWPRRIMAELTPGHVA